MIGHLSGRLLHKSPEQIVVDVNGVGSVSYTHLTLPTIYSV